jgi:hypothetical protein|tara:strand:- start:991 stop:1581 length:591 start_codon:yes stop_codon:yes gene_type:complete
MFIRKDMPEDWNKKKEVKKLIQRHNLRHPKTKEERWEKAIEPHMAILDGKKPKLIKTWSDFGQHMLSLDVSPQEAYRIISERKTNDTTRFNWKMIRFTLFVWERVKEDSKGYLKPKIDTVKTVVEDKRFKDLMYGYYPELKFDYKNEVNLLNRLIAEKIQRPYFREGYYKYEIGSGHGRNTIIPQKHLDRILWPKK